MARKSNYDDCTPAKPKTLACLGARVAPKQLNQSLRYSTGWKR
jgi:hypothetical protein